MGASKTALFNAKQNEIAQFGKLLAHPARIAILQHLLKAKSCICGELVDEIGLAQATISQHLKELKNVGLIQGTIEGTKVCYCIHPETFRHMKALFLELFDTLALQEQCC